jgi:uncharacterized protein (TIGR04168 family)
MAHVRRANGWRGGLLASWRSGPNLACAILGLVSVRIAVLGDVHTCFDDRDAAMLDEAGYDLVLFVGDLAGYRQREGLAVARSIARLRTPTLVLPGNHDGPHLLHLAAEVFGWERMATRLGGFMRARLDRLRRALGPAQLVGYSVHPLAAGDDAFSIIAARPHAMGGPRLVFSKHMRRAHGVASLTDSERHLCSLVDEAPHDRILFFAHNGPCGLGDTPDAIYGRDFETPRPDDPKDWGDPDLAAAVRYAQSRGKRVLATVAGHMHHHVKGGGRRPMTVERDGVLHVNAARVPRIFEQDGRTLRHHVRLGIVGDDVVADEILVDA